jgi:hypothetical protein
MMATEPARAALPAETVAALIAEGERLSPESALDLALAAIGETVDHPIPR